MWKGYLDKKHPAYDDYKSGFIDKAIAGGEQARSPAYKRSRNGGAAKAGL
jgi:hypothetical protein